MAYDFDLFTIGAGSGGVRASRVAAQAGAKVAIAEEFRVGGTCVIRGCVPKKYFVFASEFPQMFEDAKGFGWDVKKPDFNWPLLRENVANEVQRLSDIYVRNLGSAGVKDIIRERAAVIDPHTVQLASGKKVTAEHILLSTGARPFVPEGIPGIEHVITSNEAFLLDKFPKRAVVVGAGYIACEFASVFHGIGAETTLLYRGPKILRGFDEEVRTFVQTDMIRQGLRVTTNAMIAAIEKRGDTLICQLTNNETIETDVVMVATGRVPNSEGLGLEKVGVKLDEMGAVVVDKFSQTAVPSIYAVGDVTNRVNLTPVAIREGHAFADTVFNKRPTFFDHTDIPTAVFSTPQVGAVGCSEEEGRRRHGAIDVYKTNFRAMKNIIANNEARSLMKLIVRRSDDVLIGVHLVGPESGELIQLAAVAVKAGMTKAQWDSTCALHPTVAEELVTLKTKEPEPALAAG